MKQSTKALKILEMQKGDKISSWTSSDKKIVTVSTAGTIIGKKAGTAYVTVKLKSGISRKIKVKVQKNAVAAQKVILSKKTLVLKKGASSTIKVSLQPITFIEKVKFVSSNKSVVTVSSKGVVKARKKGTAKITVTAGKKKAVCTVKVS